MSTQYPAGSEFTFGETTVAPARRELFHQGRRVKVGSRAFDLLLLLIGERGAVVSKDRIMDVVWARRVVGENTLEGQVSVLRRALGGDRAAIKTIAGRGYQFVGVLQPEGAATCTPAGEDSTCALRCRGIPLPVQVSPLVGRQTELADVTDLLRSRRLVTLIGTGGVGKTRLAIEAARAVSACFHDGVFFAELAALVSGDVVPSAIATALGFPPGDGGKGAEKALRGLHDRRFLLVVDNCEHLVDSVARMTEAVLQIAPGATLLATSRESLRIAGECVYRVPPLDTPCEDDEETACRFGAVQLLRERIGTDLISADERSALSVMARICWRLDGIPLAIELAAACTPAFGLHGVAELLDNRFQLLRHGARTALPRQQTLRANVDWSYELLPEGSKTVLNRLSVFAGAFTLEAAHQLLGSAGHSPQDVTSAIVELVGKSLLCAMPGSPGMRYRLLETIRAYSRERLEESGAYREWGMPFLTETALSLAQHGRPDYAHALLDGAVEWVRSTDAILALPELQKAKAEIMLCDFVAANVDQAE
jgi:predicted ATPase/DNA-binding winged helix-turn-helix (wHTH) protein